MSWQLEGRYFENCSCEVPCPCTVSFSLPADYDRCKPLLVFHVDSGEVDGLDVSGITVVAVADAPQYMLEGNWRLGVLIDDGASEEQAEKLAAVFGGQMGGPMEALGPLIGEMLGVERVPMEFESGEGRHSIKIGDSTEVVVEDVVPFGVESGEAAELTKIAHPAGSTLTVAQATTSKVSAFGLEFANEGKSAFSHRFAWSG